MIRRKLGLHGDSLTKAQRTRLSVQETVEKLLVSQGWEKDRYDNFKKEIAGDHYRYVCRDNVLRYEVKVCGTWKLMRSVYWKNLKIENEKIVGWHQ